MGDNDAAGVAALYHNQTRGDTHQSHRPDFPTRGLTIN
jgi:hypothetical protein